jgi:hypothetical protein
MLSNSLHKPPRASDGPPHSRTEYTHHHALTDMACPISSPPTPLSCLVLSPLLLFTGPPQSTKAQCPPPASHIRSLKYPSHLFSDIPLRCFGTRSSEQPLLPAMCRRPQFAKVCFTRNRPVKLVDVSLARRNYLWAVTHNTARQVNIGLKHTN